MTLFGEGKIAIVTGIGPGMGRSVALGFARYGVDVAIAARREDRLMAIADEIRSLGRKPLAIPTDITDAEACRALVEATIAQFGAVDYLVQNGHHEGHWTLTADADPDQWREVFEVNVFGALHLAQAVIPEMRKRGAGAIVFVNSGAALKPPPRMGSYSASKAALANLVRILALENGQFGIRVNGVHLGATQGETLTLAAHQVAKGTGMTPEEWLANKSSEYALGFVPTPDQCAGAVLFLCSDLAQPVTGQHLGVNGGQWV